MKLVSLHIDNFGKFNNLDMSFNNGLNQLIEENGWGKSTLTAFIKVMFYGFDNSSKRDSYENERKRYKPWNGGIYGGNITFCLDDKRYTIYRTFEAKDKDDTFRLVDQRTMLVSLDYSSNIGYEIFKIDSSTFKKTLCIYENNCITESTGDIEALLGDEQSDTEDINNFDKVIKSMDDKLNALSPDRKTGELYKQFALTIATATVFSGINSLSLTPALCALFLKPTKDPKFSCIKDSIRYMIRHRIYMTVS